MQNDLHLYLPGFYPGDFLRRWMPVLTDSIEHWHAKGAGEPAAPEPDPQQALQFASGQRPFDENKARFLAGEVFRVKGDIFRDNFKYHHLGDLGAIHIRGLFESDRFSHYCAVKEIADDRFEFMTSAFGFYVFYGTLMFEHLIFQEGGEWK